MKKIILTTCALAGLALFSGCSDSDGNKDNKDSKEVAAEANEQKFDDSKIEDDTKFAVAAADGGMLEVQLGKLAATNGALPQVKEFGRQMVDEHSKANEELKALAQRKNITLPVALSEDHQKDYDNLASRKGHDFDKAYIDYMVEDHNEDIEDFKKEADNGTDAEIKAWAAGKVPVLEHHLTMAKATKDAVNK